MSNFNQRLLTGIAYVVVTLAAILFHQYSAFFFLLILGMFCQFEFLKLVTSIRSKGKIGLTFLGSATFIILVLLQDDAYLSPKYGLLFLALLMVLICLGVFTVKENFLVNMGLTIFSLFYIPASLALLFRTSLFSFSPERDTLMPYEFWHILLVFILIWASDSFAYLFGKKWGKTKIVPSISPKKSLEGLLGGLLGSLAVAYILFLIYKPIGLQHMLMIAAICTLFGFAGDLFESRIKRELGIKDSGTILPGHGGFLDRFDSILFAGPAVYLYLQYTYLATIGI